MRRPTPLTPTGVTVTVLLVTATLFSVLTGAGHGIDEGSDVTLAHPTVF